MRIPLLRGRFVILHPLRIGLVLGLVGALTWAVGAFGAAPVVEDAPQVAVPHIIELQGGGTIYPNGIHQSVELSSSSMSELNPEAVVVPAEDLHLHAFD